MHCKRIQITQAHRPGGITPRRGFLLLFCVGAVVWVYAVRRSVGRCTAFLAVGVLVYPCTVPGVLWAVCAAVGVALRRRPTFLPKKDFLTDFFKESETEHHPGEVLRFVCKLSTSSQQNGHHQRHTIHQPQQAPTDNTSEDTAARSSAELPTPRKQAILLHITSEFFRFPRVGTISPGLTLCGTVALCH